MLKYKLKKDCQIPGLAKIYLERFGYRRHGTFVEIGAYDGDSYSNTCGLADLGWRGVYVEPVEHYYEKCRKRHAKNNRVTVLNLAVGDSTGEVTIHVNGPLSTISEVALENFKRMKWWKGNKTATVPMITLNDLLSVHILPRFDLLVIDVEGYEWEVLKGFDIARWSPKMVIVELHADNPRYECFREECSEMKAFFTKHGYNYIYKDLSNSIYVRP